MEDNYIIGHLYVPIIMIILLTVMLYFHRHHIFRYLYLINLFCFLASTLSYIALKGNPLVYDEPRIWMQAMPIVFVIGIFAGYFLSVASVAAFVVEHAQRHIWARIIIGVIGLIFIASCIIGGYLFIQGILSLKSG